MTTKRLKHKIPYGNFDIADGPIPQIICNGLTHWAKLDRV